MGVFTGGRRATLPLDDQGAAWVRVTSSCDLACRFCLDADALDGSIRPFDDVAAELDRLAREGADHVVLSGGEPTRSPHLLKLVRHAKDLGLTVSLTTNGQLLAAARPCELLAKAGLDEVRISLHSGVRSIHDELVGHHGAWVRSLAAMRHAATAGLVVTLHVVLVTDAGMDIGHLIHLAAMAGVRRVRVRMVGLTGRATKEPALRLEHGAAVGLLDRLWRKAVEEGVQLDAVGFEGLGEARGDGPALDVVPCIDEAGVALLRRGIPLASVRGGVRVQDPDGKWGALLAMAEQSGGLRAFVEALRDLGAPVVDLPVCVGGLGRAEPEAAGTWVEACDGCPARATCPGVAGLIARKVGDQLGGLSG